MATRELTVSGHDGVELRCVLHEEEGGDRVAVVFPGAGYTPQAPLLWFARACLLARGLAVLDVWWDYSVVSDNDPFELWVAEDARAAVDHVGEPAVLVGKSLGTLAIASLGLDIPAVWLTPTLVRPVVREALAAVRSPALVIVGTADPLAPRELWPDWPEGVELVEVEGGDHGLEVADPLASLDALRLVVARMAAFVGGSP